MGELTDLFFILLGKLGRWFNVTGRRICFVLWAICLLYWMARNCSMGLIAQTAGCFVSLGFHLFGYFNWKAKGIGK